jgi:ketosteroid isomerase-like protein
MSDETGRIRAVAAQFLEAWSSHDVARVVACYTEDVDYRDPNLAAPIRGSVALERYIDRLFAEWRMQWKLEEAVPLLTGDGAAVMWRAEFRRVEGDRVAEVAGMDLVVLRGSKIRRNHIFFDRTALVPLGLRLESGSKG